MSTLKMLGIVFFYTALLSTVLPINSLQDKQLDAVVRLLESQAVNAKSSSASEESRDGNAHSPLEKLKTMDVINLIQQAYKNKAAENYNNRQRFTPKSNSFNQFYQNSQHDSNRNDKDYYGIKNRILEQLLKEERKPPKDSYHERLTPNRLVNLYQYRNEDEDERPKSGLQEYSKVFVILDPIALQKSRNTENLPNLLANILAQTSAAVDKPRQDRNKVQRYKGFVVHDSSKSRRYRRESKETYGGGGGGGDMEDEYRPKRSRNEHNRGGGGGRTAIPYIRHRGDIYERDH